MEQEDVGATFALLREALPIDRDDETLLLALAAAARAESYPVGTTILQQGGEPSSHLYVIRAGHVEIRVDGQLVDMPGVGEIFGELSMVAGSAPTATVRASEEVECLLLDRAAATSVLGTAGRCLVRTSQPPTWPVTSARHRRVFADQGDRTGRQRNGRHRRRAGVASRCLRARGCRIRRDEGGSGGRVVDRRLDSTVAGIRGRRPRRCSGSVGMVGSGERSAFGTSLAYRPGPRPRLRSRRSHHGGARSVLRAARRTRHVWARVRGDPALQR